MIVSKKPTITYYYRGNVERWYGHRCKWLDGYSPNGPGGREQQPWMTKDECRDDAKKQGARAMFVDREN